MSTQDSDVTETKRKPSLYFPQEFKEHLEDLVFEILKEKPRDPLEYAFIFFSKKLKTREESWANAENDEKEKAADNLVPMQVSRSEKQDSQTENTDIQSTKTSTSSNMSETKAATIIQTYFRGYIVRQHKWKNRYLKTSLNYHDHLNARHDLHLSRGSFSFYCMPEENILEVTNYDSEESLDN